MTLSQVSLLFLVQMAFGSVLSFLAVDRRALGPKYLKMGGWIVVALYGLALTLLAPAVLDGAAAPGRQLLGGAVLVAALALLAASSVSGWDRPGLEAVLLWTGALAGAVAVWCASTRGLPGAAPWTLAGAAEAGGTGAGERPGPWPFTTLEQGLVLAGAYASALVLGFTTWGMILGHWYIVSPGLPIRHLARLVRPLPWIYGLSSLLAGAALWLMWQRFLGPGNASLDDLLARQPQRMVDVASAFARIPVGLLVPLVLALMTKITVRMEKTQPATGILYAMCVLVYLGDLMGKLVQGGTGVPL